MRAVVLVIAASWVASTIALPCFGQTAPRPAAIEPPWAAQVATLYSTNDSALLWVRDRQITASARALLEELRRADQYGLRSNDYPGATLTYQSMDLAAGLPTAPEPRALDRAISLAAAEFLTHLHAGRVSPRTAGHDLDIPHAKLELLPALAALASATDVRSVLRDYEPGFRHYDLLRVALQQYRELAQSPELTQLPALATRSVKLNEPYAGMAQLRSLLIAIGDLPPTTNDPAPTPPSASPDILDDATSAALQQFQRRHGLEADGALGRATFAALTTPFSRRVQQIELALERSRWLPPKIGTPPIIVNIPQFRLFAFRSIEDRESDMLQMNVVVGKVFPETKTPVFAADLRYVVLRPYWDVPRSILTKELLPSIRNDPSWIARNGFEIVRGDRDESPSVAASNENIAALERGAARLRQVPGARNALGDVKFLFPNKYNVYLHDTPARGLFAQARRAASHGCVRVADPIGLAEHVLRSEPGWSSERIRAAIEREKPTRVTLQAPIRVFLLYATALAAEDGRVFFFEDIYGHDAKLATLLAARRQ
jgi:L,D-transpeptidase YcbB